MLKLVSWICIASVYILPLLLLWLFQKLWDQALLCSDNGCDKRCSWLSFISQDMQNKFNDVLQMSFHGRLYSKLHHAKECMFYALSMSMLLTVGKWKSFILSAEQHLLPSDFFFFFISHWATNSRIRFTGEWVMDLCVQFLFFFICETEKLRLT